MTLDPVGTAGRVSEYIESEHIVDDRPADRVHSQVYRVPDDDLIDDGPSLENRRTQRTELFL